MVAGRRFEECSMALAFKPTIHIPLRKLNMKPRSQNDFPVCIFLLLWTLWLPAERREGGKCENNMVANRRESCYFVLCMSIIAAAHAATPQACKTRGQPCQDGRISALTFPCHLQCVCFTGISIANRLVKMCRESKLLSSFTVWNMPVETLMGETFKWIGWWSVDI